MDLSELKTLTETGESEFSKAELIEDIPSFVWVDEFISAAGSYFYDNRERKPNDLDIIVRAEDDGDDFKVVLGADLRLKLDRILTERTGLASTHWHGEPHGPNWRSQPLYDLVLVPRKKMEIREINEPEFADEFYKEVHIFEKKKDEQIVSGVVYEPDVEDAQEDEATVEEIKKAAYEFMERVQRFKAFHEGKEIEVKVLESYLAPVDFQVKCPDGRIERIKKGSWILTTRVLDKKTWQGVKVGDITGYSMAGHAIV